MPVTTFQNLPYPSPTDPVDVPGDIQALAEAIDTKMLDKAVINAKGELLCGLADNTVTAVTVGSNDTVLIADSSAVPGVKWSQVPTTAIANSAVTTAKIADSNVTTVKIADNAVTTAKLAVDAAMPVGMISPYAGISAPTGWLLCDGSQVSRTTYAALFASFSITSTSASTTISNKTISGLSGMTSAMVGWSVAGTNIPEGATISSVTNSSTIVISANATATTTGSATISVSPYGFGTGANNTTTFKIPDLRHKFLVGQGASLTWSDRLGEGGGSPDAIVVQHNHGFAGWTSVNENSGYGLTVTGGFKDRVLVSQTSQYDFEIITNAGTSGTNANLPPYVVVNYIIKT